MTKREQEHRHWLYNALQKEGLTFEQCESLRRIGLTLRRWYELECGTENDFGTSFAIERGQKENGEFIADPDGKPYLRSSYWSGGQYQVSHYLFPDREKGAIKLLAAIMQPFKRKLAYYLQTDPRGAALYIIPLRNLRRLGKTVKDINTCYTSVGYCVY